MDFTNLLTKVLPFIGAAATGNVPALIGMAAKEVSDALGVEVPATAEGVSTALANATPEQILLLKDKELGFKERMQAMGFADAADIRKAAVEETKALIADTSDARHMNAQNDKVFWLGVAILGTFALVSLACLYGTYRILSGGIEIKDPSVVAAVAGFIGTIVGYVAANAQQVIAYFFGSSKGSTDKGNTMAAALKELGSTMKR